jgi:hypothetical protein
MWMSISPKPDAARREFLSVATPESAAPSATFKDRDD